MRALTVYILKCNDDSYYTGVTNDLTRRVEEHQTSFSQNSYTSKRLPLSLVYANSFDSPNDAIAFEKKIKRWSRAKKEALIIGKFDQLVKLSKKKF
ncbi:MAG: GIY-YIG nuclease family protein [Bacteroidetes bacterium]|nr:MAG: GIY-YIG nuclease family protein [Bacteroidota bacterium]